MKVVRLKPGKERSLLRRHPWVFDGAIARGSADPGETVRVDSHDGAFLAWGACSPESRIRVRAWSFDQATRIDAGFFRTTLQRALALRERLAIASNGVRLVHGESDGLPGLIVDRYGDTLVAQFTACGVERWKDVIADALIELTGCPRLYERSDTSSRQLEGLPGALQPAVFHAGAGEAHAAHLAQVIEQHGVRLRPGQQAYLIGLGDVLFMFGGTHFLEATAIDQVDVAGTELAHLHGHVDGGIAGTEDDAALGHGQLGQVVALPQFADVIGGRQQARCVFVRQSEALAGSQADAEEHRVELLVQLAQAEVVTQLVAVADLDAADLQKKFHFALGEIVDQLVGGDAVFIKAAGFLAGLEDHHLVTMHGQAMGAGQPRRAGTDHGDAFAAGRGAFKGVLAELRVIDGMALQQADQHWRALLRVVTHAGLLAEDFGGANAGAAAAEYVR